MAIISALAIIDTFNEIWKKTAENLYYYPTNKKYLVIRIKITDGFYEDQEITLIPKKSFNNFDLALLYVQDLANEKGYYNLHENPALENTAIIDEDIYEFRHGMKDELLNA